MQQLDGFSDTHAARLQALLDGPDWREALAGDALEVARRTLVTPRPTQGAFDLPVAQLVAINGAEVCRLIAAGERSEDRLLAALGTWPAEWPEDLPVKLSFLGINLGFACDMEPRCVYCNQVPVEDRMTADDWKALLRSLAPEDGPGPYASFTGGEPLLIGEALWGQDGILRAAVAAGGACNINTNALLLSPTVALGLVSSGLRRLHVSLDTHRPEVEDAIHAREGRWAEIVRGLNNVQIAKALLGSDNPQIHVNAVLTRLNADDLPGLLAFLLDMKPLVPGGVSGDLDMHLIPVGGEGNRHLRLTAPEYVRFFTETWAAANKVWAEYQAARGVPEENRGALEDKVPFMSPYHRVGQHGTLEEWAERAARGLTSALALCPRCYVAPTQAFVLPDGAQYWCGGHTVSRPRPVGSVLAGDLRGNLRRALGDMADLPGEACRGCAGATMAINQQVEGRLLGLVREWVAEADGQPAPSETGPEASLRAQTEAAP